MDFQYDEEPEYPFFNDLKKCLSQFINLSIALLIAIILIRFLELGFLIVQNSVPEDLGKVIWISLLYDLLFLLKILPLIFIPFLLVYFNTKNKKVIYLTFGILSTLIIFLDLSLIKFYSTALVPLGADLFGYSFRDIVQTLRASVRFNTETIVLFLLPIILFWWILHLLEQQKFIGVRVAVAILLPGITILYSGISVLPDNTTFQSEYSYNLSINKAAFFTERSWNYFTEDEPLVNLYASNYYEDNEIDGSASFKYTLPGFPFAHSDETEDVLGPFFNIDSTRPPNIVIIQIEGLGRAFSGPDAYLKSFTPFLDQLALKSLYFTNFLAAQGRTFASLPSIMGSLPFAEKGFNDLAERMPPHLTLPSILKKNGYTTRFYCGVDLAFDNQDLFLKEQRFDQIISEPDFESSFTKSPSYRGFSWGYADRDLFTKTLQTATRDQTQPFMLYMQTVSMHSPFLIPDQDQYLKAFESRLNKLGVNNKLKDEYRKYKNIYSTILYSDEALSMFFKEYSKLSSYPNTIFIITGDHRLPEIPLSTKIDRYHVPLLIYSPLLKRSATIRSISSHLDVTPSLLVFLKRNYKLNTPSTVAWVGSGLDTVQQFRNIHKIPIIQTKNDFHNFVSGLYFLDQNNVYSIGDNMNISLLNDESKLNELRSAFTQQKNLNDLLAREPKLIPDSIFSKFK